MRVCASCRFPLTIEPRYAVLCRSCFGRAKRMELEQAHLTIAELRAEIEELRSREPIAPDLRLVRWCLQHLHPDKHSGSTKATDATTWLLGIKRLAALALTAATT